MKFTFHLPFSVDRKYPLPVPPRMLLQYLCSFITASWHLGLEGTCRLGSILSAPLLEDRGI